MTLRDSDLVPERWEPKGSPPYWAKLSLMKSPYRLVGDLDVLPSSQVAPGTGLAADREELLGSLWSLVNPADVRWIFLTHEDGDHAGNLPEIMEAAPNARLATNYLTVGKLLEGRSGAVRDAQGRDG